MIMTMSEGYRHRTTVAAATPATGVAASKLYLYLNTSQMHHFK